CARSSGSYFDYW
nr:immunoglobulin heavy chain junction region [Mus musculus]